MSDIWVSKYQIQRVKIEVSACENENINIVFGILRVLISIEKIIIIITANIVIIRVIKDTSENIKNASIIDNILFILSYGIRVDILSIV